MQAAGLFFVMLDTTLQLSNLAPIKNDLAINCINFYLQVVTLIVYFLKKAVFESIQRL